MTPRLDLDSAAPEGERALGALDDYVARLTFDAVLFDLLRVRASQINGCWLCMGMHSRDARKGGERQHRLDALPAWREAPYFTARERAALAWTEAVTLIADGHVPDAVHAELRQNFDDGQIAAMTLALVAINGWNRLAVALRMVPSVPVPA